MLRNILTLFVVTIMLFPAMGCVAGSTKLAASDNGKVVNIKTGGLIVVELDGNPTTGFTWEAKNLDTSLLQQVGETKFKSSNPGLMGAGGTLTLTFKAITSGKTNLELVYRRPWEKNLEPLRTYSVSINIK